MSFDTYTNFLTEVENELDRSDLTSKIPGFIKLAEARINRDLVRKSIRKMETSSDITVDAQTEALPSDFLQVRRVYLNTSPVKELDYVSPHVFWGMWAGSETGRPKVYTIEGTNMLFGPNPDDSYTAKLSYYGKIPDLQTNSTNWLLTDAPDIYLFATLINASTHIREDDRVDGWVSAYSEAVNALAMADGSHGGNLKHIPKVSP